MHFPIKIAAERSGLSPQRIRMWERRYGILATSRSPTNRRQFTAEEVEHLRLLHEATEQGHRIGDLADLPPDALRDLLMPADTLPPPAERSAVQEALAAIAALDEPALRAVVERELRDHGHQALLQHLIAPLLREVGDRWEAGELRTLHEHFATAALRDTVLNTTRSFAPSADAPVMLSTTPSGQLHEMGSVLAAAAAANQGWRILYLGASLPAEEIAAAARRTRARLVALSVVHPADDPRLPTELRTLRESLPATTEILVGGGSSAAYATTLEVIGAHRATSLNDLIVTLQRLRAPRT